VDGRLRQRRPKWARMCTSVRVNSLDGLKNKTQKTMRVRMFKVWVSCSSQEDEVRMQSRVFIFEIGVGPKGRRGEEGRHRRPGRLH
jgi:hypothetical protein